VRCGSEGRGRGTVEQDERGGSVVLRGRRVRGYSRSDAAGVQDEEEQMPRKETVGAVWIGRSRAGQGGAG